MTIAAQSTGMPVYDAADVFSTVYYLVNNTVNSATTFTTPLRWVDILPSNLVGNDVIRLGFGLGSAPSDVSISDGVDVSSTQGGGLIVTAPADRTIRVVSSKANISHVKLLAEPDNSVMVLNGGTGVPTMEDTGGTPVYDVGSPALTNYLLVGTTNVAYAAASAFKWFDISSADAVGNQITRVAVGLGSEPADLAAVTHAAEIPSAAGAGIIFTLPPLKTIRVVSGKANISHIKMVASANSAKIAINGSNV